MSVVAAKRSGRMQPVFAKKVVPGSPTGRGDSVSARSASSGGDSASGSTNTDKHPSFNEMILKAIHVLDDPSGSSRYAIHKYISLNYRVRQASLNANVTKGINTLAKNGLILRTSSKTSGANGSFMLSSVAKIQGPTLAAKRVRRPSNVRSKSGPPAAKKRNSSPKKALTTPKKATAKRAKSGGVRKRTPASKVSTKSN